jgi:hypothetical protein
MAKMKAADEELKEKKRWIPLFFSFEPGRLVRLR